MPLSLVPLTSDRFAMDSSAAEKCFDAFDRENCGVLSREQTQFAMAALIGVRPLQFEVDRLVEVSHSPEGVDKATFVTVMTSKLKAVDNEDVARMCFTLYDRNCRGFLLYEDLLLCFREVMPNISPQLVRTAFHLADRDGDGRISYGEFAAILNRHGAASLRSPPREDLLS